MEALLIIDIQNDFCDGGALAVSGGNKIIPLINSLIDSSDFTVATMDWHPANHLSFASQHSGKNPGDIIDLFGVNQILWPNHCVQNTKGAELHQLLNKKDIRYIQKKGQNRKIDSYSAFFDNDQKSQTELDQYLRSQNIDQLKIVGLATDYCVKASVIDALTLNFRVKVVRNACRAVNIAKDDDQKAFKAMQERGAILI